MRTLTNILQGAEGLKLWNVKSSRELPAPQQACEQRGQVSCASWITRQHEQRETLCYGTGLGYLVFCREGEPGVSERTYYYYHLTRLKSNFEELYSRRMATGAEITCLCWDSLDERGPVRIAFGTRDMAIQVLMFDPTRHLLPIFSVQLDVSVPVCVSFVDNIDKDVQMFGAFDGTMYVSGYCNVGLVNKDPPTDTY